MNENYFRTDKTLYGRHANYVKLLREKKIFNRYIDVYKLAPIIGFLFGKKCDLDKTKSEDGSVYDASIFTEQMTKESKDIKINFRLIMILDKNYEPSEEIRMDKAFRNLADYQEDINLFESYIRGGIDIIYDKIIGTSVYKEKVDDFMENTKKLLDEIRDRYENDYDINFGS